MARKTKADLAAAAVRAELEAYFLGGDASQGLSSGFGALVSVALGGFGGSPDPERRVLWRHELGRTATPVTRARETRRRLQRLSSRHQAALWAAYGPHDWSRHLDDVFGRGMGQRVVQRLGALVGVALLTEAVRRGYEADREACEALSPVWRNEGGWLVSACIRGDDRSASDRVRREAEAMLREAVAAFGGTGVAG